MSDQVPGVTPVVAPVAPVENPAANAAFATMRTENATLKAQIDAIQAKLTEAERKDMDEKTRLTAELDDARKAHAELSGVKESIAKFQSQLESACTNELNSIPAEKRAAIEAVVSQIPLDARLTAIQNMKAVVGPSVISGGTITQPGVSPNGGLPGSPETAKPLTPDELKKMAWGSAVKSAGTPAPISNHELMSRLEALEGARK